MRTKCLLVVFFLLNYYLIYSALKIESHENINQIEIYLNKRKNGLNYIHNLKKLIYTINLGKYDSLAEVKKQKGYDYFLFIDEYDDIYNTSNWTIIILPDFVRNLNLSIIKKQRYIKTHPHIFFPDYDLSIYMDSNFKIKGDIDEFLMRILSPKQSIYILEHPERNQIQEEFKLVKILKKDNKSMINKIRKRYNRINFPDNTGLVETCLMIRKHKDITCINIMENWFEEIRNYSHRDQLSFNYVLWKTNKQIKYLSKKFCSEYLFGDYSHLKIVTFK